VNRLVDAANRGGGRDNITAVAFRLAETEEAEGEESATLISRTAEQAGLTGERMRTAADRLRGRGPMPAPRRRRRGIKIAAAVIGAVVILGGAFLLARSVYFLGTNDQGNVALYRGLPYELPLGINLYSEQYSVPVQEGTLSEDRQKAVTEHELRGKGDASSLINDIKTRPTAGLPPPPPPPTPPKKKAAASKKSKQAQQSP
jgi:protein phosphatase